MIVIYAPANEITPRDTTLVRFTAGSAAEHAAVTCACLRDLLGISTCVWLVPGSEQEA